MVTHAAFGARGAMNQQQSILWGILGGLALESAIHSQFASSLPGGVAVAVGYGKMAFDNWNLGDQTWDTQQEWGTPTPSRPSPYIPGGRTG